MHAPIDPTDAKPGSAVPARTTACTTAGAQSNKNDAGKAVRRRTNKKPKGGAGDSAEGGGETTRKPSTARKPRRKAVARGGEIKPLVIAPEWQSLWDGPSSLFPGPAPGASLALEEPVDVKPVAGPSHTPSILPAILQCDRIENARKNVPAPLHPPRQFAYDAGSLMAYQGCQWDADGFADMELSALPWLASTHGGNGEHVMPTVSLLCALSDVGTQTRKVPPSKVTLPRLSRRRAS